MFVQKNGQLYAIGVAHDPEATCLSVRGCKLHVTSSVRADGYWRKTHLPIRRERLLDLVASMLDNVSIDLDTGEIDIKDRHDLATLVELMMRDET